jgi:hypothetical protein
MGHEETLWGDPPGHMRNARFCETHMFLRVFLQGSGEGSSGEGGKGDKVNFIHRKVPTLWPKGRRIS